jgi:hypothetical protein
VSAARPSDARLREVYDLIERRVEQTWGIPVVIADVPSPFTGDLDGASIQVDYENDIENALFIVVHLDVLVIGGGITGAGIARDAARRGLKVAVVEQRDLAYGTSSRSSKLVHGGLRYLESYEFSLVFESVSERRILMDLAPHLVNPLGFLFPVYKGARQSLFVINAGMWLYDGCRCFARPRSTRSSSPRRWPSSNRR